MRAQRPFVASPNGRSELPPVLVTRGEDLQTVGVIINRPTPIRWTKSAREPQRALA
jgi:hypothetical protein